MAGVFGKDPNMKKAGGQAELDRISDERKRKLAQAAAKFLKKKPATTAEVTAAPKKK